MRVCFSNFDAPDNPWYGGGGAAAIQEVARRLAAKGWAVRVVTGRFPGAQERELDGVPYVPIGAAWAGPRWGQVMYQLALPAVVRQGGFEVWVESLTPPFSTACLQWFTRRPVVALTQVMAGHAMYRQYRLPFHVIERLGLRTYRYAVATSGHLRAQILAANPGMRVEVIPNGTAPELARLGSLPAGTGHALFLGRLAPNQKGLDLLLHAWAGAASRIPVPLVIAGAGLPGDETRLRRQAEDLGLSAAQLRWAGKVSGAVKDALLREAMFLVMPSRYEASPLVAVEAFCYGLPVVAFDIPDLTDLPASCCLKVAPVSAGALGRAMTDLARDPARRSAMAAAAREHARRLDWDHLGSRYDQFLRSLIDPERTERSR